MYTKTIFWHLAIYKIHSKVHGVIKIQGDKGVTWWLWFHNFCGLQSSFWVCHTVSSQDFRSFCFLSFSLSQIMQLNFFRKITTYTSRHLSFDNFFLTWSWSVTVNTDTGLDYWFFLLHWLQFFPRSWANPGQVSMD